MNLSVLPQSAYAPIERIPAFGLGKALGQDFRQLSESLGSGDVEGAQSTFNDLKKLLQSTGSIGAATSVKDSLDSLGKDLGAGSVSLAQQDLRQLQSDLQTVVQANRVPLPGLPVHLPAPYRGGLDVAKRALQSLGRVFA